MMPTIDKSGFEKDLKKNEKKKHDKIVSLYIEHSICCEYEYTSYYWKQKLVPMQKLLLNEGIGNNH